MTFTYGIFSFLHNNGFFDVTVADWMLFNGIKGYLMFFKAQKLHRILFFCIFFAERSVISMLI